ncbi:unnamed protein product [Caenorhabditis brenneri]
MRFQIFVLLVNIISCSLSYPYYQTISDQLGYPTYQIGTGAVPDSASSYYQYYQNSVDPYNQPYQLWNTDTKYQIGGGVLSSSSSSNTQNPYNPYYPYYSYNWDTFNTDYYNPYNNQ